MFLYLSLKNGLKGKLVNLQNNKMRSVGGVVPVGSKRVMTLLKHSYLRQISSSWVIRMSAIALTSSKFACA